MRCVEDAKKEEFPKAHLSHRLTLLRTFKRRQRWFKEELQPPNCHGDLARCAKDSALISIRLLTGAMALRVLEEPKHPGNFQPRDHREKRVQAEKKRRADDIWISDLGGTLPITDDLTGEDKQLLVGTLKRADKEQAHLTDNFNEEFNTAKTIIAAIDLVERLLDDHLFKRVGMSMPEVDCGIGWNRYFFVNAP